MVLACQTILLTFIPAKEIISSLNIIFIAFERKNNKLLLNSEHFQMND